MYNILSIGRASVFAMPSFICPSILASLDHYAKYYEDTKMPIYKT
jgi:hypothetical protein